MSRWSTVSRFVYSKNIGKKGGLPRDMKLLIKKQKTMQ